MIALDLLILGAVMAIGVPLYWVMQMRTGFWSTRYFTQTGTLVAIGAISFWVALRAITTLPIDSSLLGILPIVILLVALFSGGYHWGLVLFKLTTEADTRYRGIHKANRALVNYSEPHEKFVVKTDDGVLISGVLLNHSPLNKKAIIVCHGAGRSKNTMPIVQTCEILATQYAVFAFDFRGHMESSGTFRADGDTEFDLKAVIEFVRGRGYDKVAVFGWSIGAWTALLSASLGRQIDAIIAGSPPPMDLASMSQIGLLRRFFFIGMFVRGGISVIRNFRLRLTKTLPQILDFVQQMPSIPVLLVYNEYDYTSKVDSSKFEELFQRLPPGREKYELPGKGHLFDWPNTYFLWNKMFEWLEARF